jgi:hypothetical protein
MKLHDEQAVHPHSSSITDIYIPKFGSFFIVEGNKFSAGLLLCSGSSGTTRRSIDVRCASNRGVARYNAAMKKSSALLPKPQAPCSECAASMPEVCAEFVIQGKVQGVFFRKHTLAKATELGLKGNVCNASDGSVTGYVQGSAAAVDAMKM